MSKPATRISLYVLEQLPRETVAKRISLLSDLAQLAKSPAEAAELESMADALRAEEKRQARFTFNYRQEAAR